MPVLARGLRDYLIRHAKDDGTLLERTDSPGRDLARALGAHENEISVIESFVELLISDGYLSHKSSKLSIRRFKKAQQSQSAGARRQRDFRERKRTLDDVTRNVTGNVTGNEARNATVTPTRARGSDEIRSDEMRSDHQRDDDPCSTDRELPCPLNLVTRADELGVLRELAQALGVDIPAVRKEADKFVAYWTIGGGALRKRRNWLGRLRERIREQHDQGKLKQSAAADPKSSSSPDGWVLD